MSKLILCKNISICITCIIGILIIKFHAIYCSYSIVIHDNIYIHIIRFNVYNSASTTSWDG